MARGVRTVGTLGFADAEGKNLTSIRFTQQAVERGYNFTVGARKVSGRLFDDSLVQQVCKEREMLVSQETRFVRRMILHEPMGLTYIAGPHPESGGSDREWDWECASHAWNLASLMSRRLDSLIPALEPGAPNIVPVSFWALGNNGPVKWRRDIEAPSWGEIASNYPPDVASGLADLMWYERPVGWGQLLLFQGPPGTGKTYAIRAMAREWRPWCDVSYIADPDQMFKRAHYMLDVLLEGEEAGKEMYRDGKLVRQSKWHLMVVEDADEFITIDAKERSGQALSRLLNLTEGFVGQGLRVLLMLTTNEPIAKLHPAVGRPGRCLANIEFREFQRQEAGRWLASRGAEGSGVPSVPERATLADLYERTRSRRSVRVGSQRLVGLRA